MKEPINLLENAFSQETSNPSDVVKELFKADTPEVKTDLTPEQISIITRLYFQAEIMSQMLGEEHGNAYKLLLDKFIVLRISNNRKSRAEFVEAHKSSMPENRSSGVWGNIAGAFRGR